MKAYLHAHANGRNSIHLALDPGPDLIRFVGKLTSESLIVLLLAKFVLQSLVTLRNERFHFAPFGFDVLERQFNMHFSNKKCHNARKNERSAHLHRV